MSTHKDGGGGAHVRDLSPEQAAAAERAQRASSTIEPWAGIEDGFLPSVPTERPDGGLKYTTARPDEAAFAAAMAAGAPPLVESEISEVQIGVHPDAVLPEPAPEPDAVACPHCENGTVERVLVPPRACASCGSLSKAEEARARFESTLPARAPCAACYGFGRATSRDERALLRERMEAMGEYAEAFALPGY